MNTEYGVEPVERGFWLRHRHWLLPVLLLDVVVLIVWLVMSNRAPPPAEPQIVVQEVAAIPEPPPPPLSQLATLVCPTAQDLRAPPLTAGLLQPTASGKPESGLFGSVRTSASRRGMAARFHEGVDIAPLARDRHGRPTDVVRAIAPGAVAYVNTVAGNSDYGKYVVLLHKDDVGSVYSLYGHLASIESNVRSGAVVDQGQPIGLMGNTSLSRIPVDRSHLHLEIGLLLNPRYDRWVLRSREKRPGGCYNGLNLFGVDPLDVFRHAEGDVPFTFENYLKSVPEAFRIVFSSSAPPLFFTAHPQLWDTSQAVSRAITVSVAESGMPLRGAYATPAEETALGTARTAVLNVNEATLGRNGRHYVMQRNGRWAVTTPGEQWLQILTFRP